MLKQHTLLTRHARTIQRDPAKAVSELRDAMEQEEMQLVLFFCSADYDLNTVAAEWNRNFQCEVIGCTTAGQIDSTGITKSGIVAVSFSGETDVKTYEIDLNRVECDILKISEQIAQNIQPDDYKKTFGILLIDGLSGAEEMVTALLYQNLPNIPVVGGSAADNFKFKKTQVFYHGNFKSGRAVLLLVQTERPFVPIKMTHVEPSDRLVVVTGSDPLKRVIRELNGEPAAACYARAVGMPVSELNASVYSANPLVLELAGREYVRSIARANADGSLDLFCTIQDGVVLSIGRAKDPLATIQCGLEKVERSVGKPALIILFNCALSQLEYDRFGITSEVGKIFQSCNVIGFNTFGEQYNGVHLNQTLTGIALGEVKP